MSNKLYRPLNTWGIYILGITTGWVVIYAITQLL